MPYEVVLHREARKELLELPAAVYRQVYRELSELSQQPRPRKAAKLKGHEDLWRLRVGRFRVVYQVNDPQQIVTVLRVVLRTERTYRGR